MTAVGQTTRAPEPVPVRIGGVRAGPARTVVLRRDRWRLQPAATAAGLLAFVAYSTWAAFRNGNYYAGGVGRDYLSPFYSPCLTHNCHGYVWGPITGSWWEVSPALLILIFPLGFRLTCYYYRKAYYRSFWLSPPACGIADAGSTNPGGPRARYTGRDALPARPAEPPPLLLLRRVLLRRDPHLGRHRRLPLFRRGGCRRRHARHHRNAVLIWAYTLGCHACRHLCGGNLRALSKAPLRRWFWQNMSGG